MKKRTANIIGATGLVGTQLVQLILEDDRFEQLNIYTRHSTGFNHPKIKEQLVDFEQIDQWKSQIKGDILFSSLGTTLKKAGSVNKQFLIDYTYQFNVAEAAAQQGVSTYVLISSAGANSNSRLFYSKMKGELDEDVRKLNFEKTIILRPSILDGNRLEKRTTEQISLKIARWITKFIFQKYRPIHAKTVAKAMINAVFIEHQTPAYSIYELDELFEIANGING